ncbi:hypothetical protein [Microbacterium sp. NC79]|uniref:hypothetical protein n=1 Tax=Microbacterium sp. NC79 TaxID=2851009 RepID=UPI001C2BD6B3|nr:hypothetical protein [Microbacterium sp. NC79]MBV0894904.1 hypothetical protein [Microbacterium sp. NC79]
MASFKSRELTAAIVLPTLMSPLGEHDSEPVAIRATRHKLGSVAIVRGGRSIGRFLTASNALLMDIEEGRRSAVAALQLAGFSPLSPVTQEATVGEPILRLLLETGAGGSPVIYLRSKGVSSVGDVTFGAYDPSTQSLVMAAEKFEPHMVRLLDLCGLSVSVATVRPHPSISAKTRRFVTWDDARWIQDTVNEESRIAARGNSVVRRAMLPQLADRFPKSIVNAVNETLDFPTDSWRRIRKKADQTSLYTFPSIDELRVVGRELQGISLPNGWHEVWAGSLKISPYFAGRIAALDLRDSFNEWWQTIPPTHVGSPTRDRFSIPESMYNPSRHGARTTSEIADWFEAENGRVVTVAALLAATVGSEIPDTVGFEPCSCPLCGTKYSPAELSIKSVREHMTEACPRCLSPVRQYEDTTPTQRAGALSAIQHLVRTARRIVQPNMFRTLVVEGDIDPIELLVLKHALPDKRSQSWSGWLAEAGVLGKGWRPSYGFITKALDGHDCRSLFERIVDDFFSSKALHHIVEPAYPYDSELNQHGMRADWLVDGRVFVEAAGLTDMADYAQKIERKKILADRHNLELVILTPDDLTGLAAIFQERPSTVH